MDERDWSTPNQDCWLSTNGKWCKCDQALFRFFGAGPGDEAMSIPWYTGFMHMYNKQFPHYLLHTFSFSYSLPPTWTSPQLHVPPQITTLVHPPPLTNGQPCFLLVSKPWQLWGYEASEYLCLHTRCIGNRFCAVQKVCESWAVCIESVEYVFCVLEAVKLVSTSTMRERPRRPLPHRGPCDLHSRICNIAKINTR